MGGTRTSTSGIGVRGWTTSGPIEIEGEGTYPDHGKLWNTATRYRVEAKYENGISMTIAGGHPDIRSGTKWIGDQGWVWVDRSGLDAEPKSLLNSRIGPGEIHLFRSPGHTREFIQCVKSRALTLAPAEVAQRSATPGFLGQIAMLTGRKIKWDPINEKILGIRKPNGSSGVPCGVPGTFSTVVLTALEDDVGASPPPVILPS